MSLVSVGSLHNFPYSILLACEICQQYIKNSFLFKVPYKESELRDKIKKVNLQQNLPIICYDKGSMYSASRVYCFLLAAGYTDVKVLYGGLRACLDHSFPLITESPDEIPLTEGTLLPLRENLIISKEEFILMSTKNLNTIYANFLDTQIYNIYKTLSAENVQKFLKNSEVRIEGIKNCIFYGELASLLAVFAHFLSIWDFSIVIIDFDSASYGESIRSSSKETIYVSLGDILSQKSMTSTEMEHYATAKSQNRSSRDINESVHSTPCGRCSII